MSGEMMTTRRRTVPRATSQAATRRRLLDVAERLVVTESIPGLSVRRLCVEAGFTQGAFYSNFDGKDALLLALLERHVRERHLSLAEVSEAVSGCDVDHTLAALAAWLRDLGSQREWASLAVELRLHERRDPAFGKLLAAADERMNSLFANLLNALAEHFGLRPLLPCATIADTLMGLWHSLALRETRAIASDQIFVLVLRSLLGIPVDRGSP